MPACAALGCHQQKNAVLKAFPRKDRRLRQIWIERVNRPGWIPTKHSSLCERHFDRDQWESTREDGKRKLKNSAVPTIFVVRKTIDGEVARDHSYCLPFYRKIYEDIKADTPEDDAETMPIEHIKVEVDENENFTPETIEEENEEDNGSTQEDIESIQCTPDISVYPERGEPFPIEMVDCKNDGINAFMAEPDNDPLAISAEDQVQAAQVKPYFGNCQKLVFVPQRTRTVVNIPTILKGDPKVNSLESTETSIVKPQLKVKGLDGLLDPNVLLKHSQSKSKIVDSKTILRSPSAVYLKEKLTLSDEPAASSVPKCHPPGSKKKLEVDQTVVTLTSHKFTIPPKLKIIPTSDPSLPKLNLVTTQISFKNDPNFIRNTTNLKIEKPVVLPSRPNILINNSNDKHFSLNTPQTKLVKPGLLKCDPQHVLVDKNIKTTFKPNKTTEKEEGTEKSNENDKSNEFPQKSTVIKRTLLNHQFTDQQILKQLTSDGLVKEGNVSNTQIGNNDVRLWLDSNIPSVKNKSVNNAIRYRPILPKTLAPSSSVIVLKPLESLKSVKGYTGGNMPKCVSTLNRRTTEDQSRTITNRCDECQTLFMNPFALRVHKLRRHRITNRCDECQTLFMSPFALRVHKLKTGHRLKKMQGNYDNSASKRIHNENKDEVIIDKTYSENSIDSLGSNSQNNLSGKVLPEDDSSVKILSGDDSSVEILSDIDSETDSVEEFQSSLDENSNNTIGSETDSAFENEEIELTRESVTLKENCFNQGPIPLENKFLKIRDINALINLKKDGFLRLSSIGCPKSIKNVKLQRFISDKGTHKTLDGLNKSESFSCNNDDRMINLSKNDAGKMEENLANSKEKLRMRSEPSSFNIYHKKTHKNTQGNSGSNIDNNLSKPQAKLIKETLLIKNNKVSQKSEVVMPKIDLREKIPIGVENFNTSEEKELIFVSDDSNNKISSESEGELSYTQENQGDSLPSAIGNRISELIINKNTICLEGELPKINKKRENDCSSEKAKRLYDTIRMPIVLLSKVDAIRSNTPKEGNNSRVNSLEEIVLSDDENFTRKGQGNSCKKNNWPKSFQTLKVPNEVHGKMAVGKSGTVERILVDLTSSNKCEIVKEEQTLNRKPTILLPKSKRIGMKKTTTLETKCKRAKIGDKNKVVLSQENDIGENKKSSFIHRVPCVSSTTNKELGNFNEKIQETCSLNLKISPSLVYDIKGEGRKKKTVVNSIRKRNIEIGSQNEYKANSYNKNYPDSMNKTFFPENICRITRNRLKTMKGDVGTVCHKNEGMNVNQHVKCKKTYGSVKSLKTKPKLNEEKCLENPNRFEKLPKSPTKKCQLCGEIVQKSQLKRHVLQHDPSSVCSVCRKRFSHSVLLRRHMKKEHFF